MRISDDMMRQIESDLGLKLQIIKGQNFPIRNCWHFTTDGSAVDAVFRDDDDFRLGMNRIYVVRRKYRNVIILAFCLMDTHIHFILYGDFHECNRFIHEYVKMTSIHISRKYGDRNKMKDVPIHYQQIDDDRYLKNAICYVLKNATVAGMPFLEYDYPWSSAPLLLKETEYWNSPNISRKGVRSGDLTQSEVRKIFQTRTPIDPDVLIIDSTIHPAEYVAVDIVKRIFRSRKSLHFFMCITKDSDIESVSGANSYLSIPMQEMRQHKTELCLELFGKNDIRTLDTDQRVKLARTLKSRFNSSSKQILRLCGLASKGIKL